MQNFEHETGKRTHLPVAAGAADADAVEIEGVGMDLSLADSLCP